MCRRLLAMAAAVLVLGAAGPALAETALVAVAANFAGAAEAVSKLFAEETGHRVEITTGSTGKLYAQIREGAPFDVLLSADAATPERLEVEGETVAGTRFTYAVGRLALWSADAERIGDDPVTALTDAATLHIAIANPDLAPYGAAARQTLESLDLWEDLQPKIAMGQNIGQTYSLVASGAAQVGFVALSAIDAPGADAGGSRWDVPQALFDPIRQDAVLLKKAEGNEAAKAFLDFLRGAEARAIMLSFGYGEE